MANDLTGEFDVVAEFSLPAVNRLLSAMHGIKRFPHSLALRVDDIPQPPDSGRPSVFEVVDLVGDPIANPHRIRVVDTAATTSPAATVLLSRLGGIVNTNTAGIFIPPTVPSKLQGRAQLQLSPPTLEIADAAASRIAVRIHINARYLADPGTPPASEFAKGDMVLTTAVSQIASQAGNVVDIDLRSNAVQAAFTPTWSSRPLSTEDRAGINLLISNALKSSVLPSNNTLPTNIRSMKFKAVAGAEQAVAVLLNTTSAPGNPASMHRVFLGGSDFAFAAGADLIKSALQPALDQILTTTISPVQISIPLGVTSATATYTITLNTAVVQLETGRILLTVAGRATSPSWFAPNFDFTMKQAFGLQADGSTADLVVGETSLDTSSWIVDRFRGRAMGPLSAARDRALSQSGARSEVRRMLDADRNLGGFFRSLLTPARPDGQPQPQPLGFTLTYGSVEITPSGIVLRGSLAVAAPTPAQVEFAEIRVTNSGPVVGGVQSGPEYSGFKSWIPGGAIASYEWKRAGQTQSAPRDENTFMLLPEGPVVVSGAESGAAPAHGLTIAFNPMCLTIHGSRLSASGPVVLEAINASYCAFLSFPVFDVALVNSTRVPLVALTRPGPQGEVEIVGHTPAVRHDDSRPALNLIVHFGDARSAGELNRVTDALRKSARTDAPTAIVAVLPADAITRARHVEGVVYAEQTDDSWARVWDLKIDRRPTTFVIGPDGKVLWEHAGDLDAGSLTDILRRELVPSRAAKISMAAPGVAIGQAPPNFLFSHAPGHELTLRKLAGRPVVVIFWRSDARISLDAVRRASTKPYGPPWKDAVILAVNDGEPADLALKHGADLAATIVPDPMRSISRAFGVSAWPTVVLIDARGVVRDVQHGTSVLAGRSDGSREVRV